MTQTPKTHRFRQLRALVLHRTPVREKDRVVEVLTREEGMRRLFAPGVRHIHSRRAGHLEPLMETRVAVVRSSRGDAVREAHVLRTFPRLRADLARLRVAYAVARLIHAQLREGVPDHSLYDAILVVLDALDEPSPPSPYLVEGFQVHLLRSLGVLPDLYRCSHCRRPLLAGMFSLRSTQRGFWCTRCGGHGDPLLTDVVKLCRLLLVSPASSLRLLVSPPVERRLRGLLRALLRAHAHEEPARARS